MTRDDGAQRRRRTARHVYFTMIALGLALRAAWIFVAPAAVFADAAGYRALARGLAEGRGFDGAYWMPAWPAWMSFAYRAHAGDVAVMLASVALGALTIAATRELAREIFGDDAADRAAAIVALVPSLVLLPQLLLSENLAVPLFAIAALALVRAARTAGVYDWIAVGIATALSVYVRESSLALVLAALGVAAWKRDARGALIVALVVTVALAPWVLRNRALLGHATLTTSSATNLCIGLGDGATGGFRKIDPVADTACARAGLAAHPLELVTLAPAKLTRLFVWDDWIVDDFLDAAMARARLTLGALRALCNLFWWGLCAFSAASFARSRGAHRERAKALSAPIVAVVASVIVTFGVARFHAPLIPLLAAVASGYRRRS